MIRFHALTKWANPRLYVWRPTSDPSKPVANLDLRLFEHESDGFKVFPADLGHQIHEPVFFKLCAKENEKELWKG